MNGHATKPVETLSHLTNSGIKAAQTINAEEPSLRELDASNITMTLSTTLRTVPDPNSAEVWASKSCTDHMVTVTYTDDYGWHAPEIKPYGPLTLMPTASCLHYATQCFEGMKVYRGYDGKLRLFRPDLNCKRLAMSSVRVALPSFDPAELEKLLKALLKLDGPREYLVGRSGSSSNTVQDGFPSHSPDHSYTSVPQSSATANSSAFPHPPKFCCLSSQSHGQTFQLELHPDSLLGLPDSNY